MKLQKPVPKLVVRHGIRYNWFGNYVTKAEAQKRVDALKRQSKKAIILSIEKGIGIMKYAVYYRII